MRVQSTCFTNFEALDAQDGSVKYGRMLLYMAINLWHICSNACCIYLQLQSIFEPTRAQRITIVLAALHPEGPRRTVD